jgi:hypothetical protein
MSAKLRVCNRQRRVEGNFARGINVTSNQEIQPDGGVRILTRLRFLRFDRSGREQRGNYR